MFSFLVVTVKLQLNQIIDAFQAGFWVEMSKLFTNLYFFTIVFQIALTIFQFNFIQKLSQ